MKINPTVCALYTRVSSRNQLDRDYSSMETQRERLEAYCRSQENYQIYRVYEDGAYSAENIDRPALKQMLADIRAGRINCVLAYKIDRLTRSVKDFHVLMEILDRHNVKFVSITQSLDTQHPMGRLLRNILLDFAQFEREMTADRTRDKMHQRAAKGMWNGGNVPYGYLNENKRLVRNENEAQRVQFIFEWFAQCPSLAGLRAELHRRGWFNRAGHHWMVTALDCILRNTTYIGKIGFNDLSFVGQHEPIIGEALFQKVQSLHRERGHVTTTIKRPFLLKGLLHCSDCGSAMTPHYVQKRRKDGSVNRIPYYRCTRTLKFNNGVCRIKHLNADKIEATVVENLFSLSQNEAALNATVRGLNHDLKQKIEPLEKEATQIKQRLAELEGEIDCFVLALGKGTIAVERLEQEMRQRGNDKKVLQMRFDGLQQKINEEAAYDYNSETVLKNLREFRNVFEALTPQEKVESMRCLLKRINALPGKLVLEVYELADFKRGSQKSPDWLSDMDSNHE
jgi:site-specific DNA recombinase